MSLKKKNMDSTEKIFKNFNFVKMYKARKFRKIKSNKERSL